MFTENQDIPGFTSHSVTPYTPTPTATPMPKLPHALAPNAQAA